MTVAVDFEAPRVRPLWRQGPFVRLFLGQVASQVGFRIQLMALLWWVVAASGEHRSDLGPAGLLLAVASAPSVVVPPLAGKLADRIDKRLILVLGVGLQAAFALALAALAWRTGAAGGRDLGFILPLVGLGGVVGMAYVTTNLAATPAVVDDAQVFQANAAQETVFQGAGLIGPPLGGLVVGLWGVQAAFALAAGCMALCAGSLMGLPSLRPTVAADADGDAPRSWSLRGDRPLFSVLAVLGLLNFFTIPLLLFFPYLARQTFHTGAPGVGALEAALAVGMAGGAALVGRLQPAEGGGGPSPATQVVVALAAVGGFYGLFAAWPAAWPALVEVAVIGALVSVVNVHVTSAVQRRVPPHAVGAAMGWLVAITSVAVPLSFAAFGPLADRFTPLPLLGFNGVAILGVAALFASSPAMAALRGDRLETLG